MIDTKENEILNEATLNDLWQIVNKRIAKTEYIFASIYVELQCDTEELSFCSEAFTQVKSMLAQCLNEEQHIFKAFDALHDSILLMYNPYDDLMVADTYMKQLILRLNTLLEEQGLAKYTLMTFQLFTSTNMVCFSQAALKSIKDCIKRLNIEEGVRHQHVHAFYNILIKRDLHTLFQPILSLEDEKIFAFEALSRGPEGSPFYSPLELFTTAESEGSLYLLERIAREKALENAQSFLGNVEKLFININAQVIYDDQFTSGFTHKLLNLYNIDTSKVVFEITERNAILDFQAFKKVLKHYRDQGFQIAVDDAGAGYSSLQTISELSPEYIKVDRSIVQNIQEHPFKQQVLEMFVNVSKQMGTKVIAEGIETMEELHCIHKIGVNLAQGFLFSKPLPPSKCRELVK